jgi:hypothetical protein
MKVKYPNNKGGWNHPKFHPDDNRFVLIAINHPNALYPNGDCNAPNASGYMLGYYEKGWVLFEGGDAGELIRIYEKLGRRTTFVWSELPKI